MKRILNKLNRRKKKPDFTKQRMLLMREQTLLSRERTTLSFIRTGIAAIGAGIVIINIFHDSISSLIIGWGFVITGIIAIIESYRSLRRYQKEENRIQKSVGD